MNRDLTETAMGTAEIIIVFSALMALVALVTIGIDWIGKPLKHRRFIPRMYRFEDEKLPIDEYGHTSFDMPEVQIPGIPIAGYVQAPPVVVATVPPPMAPMAPAIPGAADTVAVPITPEAEELETDAADDDSHHAAPAAATHSSSAFSDSLSATTSGSAPAVATTGVDSWLSTDTASSTATVVADRPASAWHATMALDATINDRKPNLATKAQRFWMATAHGLGDSHFDDDNRTRMQNGKPPRRSNPRTGRTETMQLSGLRQASQPGEVRMSWPDDSTDPWSSS